MPCLAFSSLHFTYFQRHALYSNRDSNLILSSQFTLRIASSNTRSRAFQIDIFDARFPFSALSDEIAKIFPGYFAFALDFDAPVTLLA